jgi:hypothetical protein
MNWKRLLIGLALSCAIILGSGTADAAKTAQGHPATLLATGLGEAIGSTLGPDGALYVPQCTLGSIARVDPRTGTITTFASGLPKQLPSVGLGGATDVAFIGMTAYVLVTLVSPDVGGHDVDGIYRVDGPDTFTVVANIGAFNLQNPPTISFPYVVKTGLQFALQPYRDGFLVTDGHLNRVLQVSLDGAVSVVIAFGDVVPTGMAVWGNRVYMAEAGPVPFLPQNGKVVAFNPQSPTATEVASGASLLVGVRFGPGRRLYALSQGENSGNPAGSPALPNTGSLVEANQDGTFTVITSPLDRPTSMQFIGNTAYVVTYTGQIWKIDVSDGGDHD